MTAIEAARSALAAEYAAAYGYGVVGAFTTGAARRQAARALAWHQAQQPLLLATVSSAGGDPPSSQPAYVLPFAVTNAVAAARLGATLEEGVAAAYAGLVEQSASGDRRNAALALAQCAVRAAQWRGYSVPFPGLPERAVSP